MTHFVVKSNIKVSAVMLFYMKIAQVVLIIFHIHHVYLKVDLFDAIMQNMNFERTTAQSRAHACACHDEYNRLC